MGRRGSMSSRRPPFPRNNVFSQSPLGQFVSSSSSPTPQQGIDPNNDSDSPGTDVETPNVEQEATPAFGNRKRKWTASCWDHYNTFDGQEFADKRPRAYCKYCNKGPVFADSNFGTANFRRHTESCQARNNGDVGQMFLNKKDTAVLKYNPSVYKEKVALAIIRHGYSYTFAEHEGNRDIHMYLNENCKPICRNTARTWTIKIHQKEKKKLKKALHLIPGKICLTSDMWSSVVGQGYLSLTAHYIDENWKLHNKILNFCHVPPPHNAQVLHDTVLDILKTWGIHKKIFSITLDNARCNDNMQDLLADSLSVFSRLPGDGEYFHIRCGAHVLNLIVQDGLKFVSDSLGKIRQLVRHWTSSEARKLKFAECASGVGVDCSRGLWLDCPTRWNSSFMMIERALVYKVVFSRLGRSDTSISGLIEEEWSKLGKICDLLRPFDLITKQFSGRNYPTSNLYLMHVWTIESLILSYCNNEDQSLSNMAKGMKSKFDKYWENYSMILSMAAVLDPRLKLQYVKFCFVQLDAGSADYKTDKVKECLFKLFEEYSRVENASHDSIRVGGGNTSLAAFSTYENSSSQGRTQLDDYLGEHKLDPLSDLDVLGWWKDNGKRFPQVANMARDLLSIPITTVASESSFSLGSRILTKWRASLLPESAETLVTTRSWLYGYDVEKDNNSLEDGVEIPILRDPSKQPQVIVDEEQSGVEIIEDDDDF